MTPLIICELRHGVRLTMENVSGELTIADVTHFLRLAKRHFSKLGGSKATVEYAGNSYRGETDSDDVLELTRTGAHRLSVGRWSDAVLLGFSVADTVEEISNSLPMFRKSDDATGGGMRNILALFNQPGGDLLALVEMHKQFLARTPTPFPWEARGGDEVRTAT